MAIGYTHSEGSPYRTFPRGPAAVHPGKALTRHLQEISDVAILTEQVFEQRASLVSRLPRGSRFVFRAPLTAKD